MGIFVPKSSVNFIRDIGLIYLKNFKTFIIRAHT